MGSQALEILEALGGETVRYIPRLGSPRTITALVDPIRRTDELGNQSFLTKTYEVWIVKDAKEGIESVTANADGLSLKLQPNDAQETLLKITKIYPERDQGVPGDRVGMWHLEAVA
jgi:hypothetical protein